MIWLENIDTQKNQGWSVRNERHNDQLILVDRVDDEVEEIVHELILQTIDNARSK